MKGVKSAQRSGRWYGTKHSMKLYKSSVYKWGYNTDDRTPWEGVRRIMPNRLYVFVSGRILNVDPYPYFDWTKNQPKEDLGPYYIGPLKGD